jgi:hypothetical protein
MMHTPATGAGSIHFGLYYAGLADGQRVGIYSRRLMLFRFSFTRKRRRLDSGLPESEDAWIRGRLVSPRATEARMGANAAMTRLCGFNTLYASS